MSAHGITPLHNPFESDFVQLRAGREAFKKALIQGLSCDIDWLPGDGEEERSFRTHAVKLRRIVSPSSTLLVQQCLIR